MKDELPLQPLPHRETREDLGPAGSELLTYDRPSWAWEFLRRNDTFLAALKGQPASKRQTRSNITIIEAKTCAPEVRKFGICFR